MAKYFGIVGTAAVTLMPGFTTPGAAAAKPSNTALTKNAAWKDHLILAPAQNTALTAPASAGGGMTVASTTQLMSGIATGAATFYSVGSFCLGTAFTKSTKVRIDKFRGSLKRSATHKYFVDAYSVNGTASTRVASLPLGTFAGNTGAWANPSASFTTASTKTIIVPTGGHLVMRAVGNGGTSSGIKFTTGWNAGKLSAAFILITTETAAVTGALVENRERFHDSKGVALPIGTKVYEYDALTMAHTGNVGLIGFGVAGIGSADANIAQPATGVGEVVFTRAFGDVAEYFYVVPDPASGNLWQAAVYGAGAQINPAQYAKLVALCTVGGATAASEPLWGTLNLVAGDTVIDGAVTWTMRDVETICTNAVKGYQLGYWTTGMTAVIAAVGVDATRIAPAGAGQYALCTTAGTAGVNVPVWPVGISNGVTTVVDGSIVWTMYTNESYV